MAGQAPKFERIPIRSSEDIVLVRQAVRSRAVESGFSLVDQTKIVTAASELARNTLIYGGGGTAQVETLDKNGRPAVRLIFEDHGPGIPDINKALQDGFTTGSGLGLGLGGAKRLSNEFEIHSTPGEGTRVAITRWKA
jgi:serine/threonine-protein kinase RsbT